MPRTLLLVDDDPSVRETLRFLLTRRGYTVVPAENGMKALALAGERHIDGALVDVHMPGMSGVEVCRLLRAQAAAKGQTLPVWIMTGARTPEVVKAAERAGALVVLAKPFDYADLFRRFEAQFGEAPKPPDDEVS
jgi:DNA-binding response OmpR family regulator